jgi:NAD(P)-dependent dehydrogenase (short-subunit alcohol dehydrogenase family)
MKIPGTTAVVTGAASGLGAATAKRLARLGANVVGFDLSTALEDAEQVDGVTHVPVDVTDTRDVAAGLDAAEHLAAPLRIVVNCAGIAPSARVLSSRGPHDPELFATVVRVNLVGTFNVLSAASERIARTEADDSGQRGVILNTASIAGYEGQIGQVAYAASKGGVISMTLPAARDLARHGIRVNAIAPGVMETPMLATVSDEYRSALSAHIPFPQRLGIADEYAGLATFLIEHDYMNGEVVRMDGALRMSAT